MQKQKWNYEVSHIAKALSRKRLGGRAYISLCGAGETLICDEVIALTRLLLTEGHVVNITTNGMLDRQFDKLIKIPADLLKYLNVSFSFHYLELKKSSGLERFFENITKIRNAGASFVLQLNWYDGYMPYMEEIKEISYQRVGAYPQLALTRREVRKDRGILYEIYTNGSEEEYIRLARAFHSPLFEYTLKNFNVKRKEFCYAGLWSGVLDLQAGELSKCYGIKGEYIFDDLEKNIRFSPVGNNCKSNYCVNSSHFMALGVIPEIKDAAYGELRNRKEAAWYNKELEELLNDKLWNNNRELTQREKNIVNLVQLPYKVKDKLIKCRRDK